MSSSDSDRPPFSRISASLRTGTFAGLSLAQRFQRIHDTNLWGAAASTSGLGSEIDATAVLRAELPRLLQKLGVTSLLDAPCGDAGWINAADLGVRYVGVDIVPALIERLRARAAAGEIKGEYQSRRYHRDSLPRCDAILCRDASGASVVCQYRTRGCEFQGVRRDVADRDHVSGVAGQPRLRGRRLARAEFRARAVQLGAAGRTV